MRSTDDLILCSTVAGQVLRGQPVAFGPSCHGRMLDEIDAFLDATAPTEGPSPTIPTPPEPPEPPEPPPVVALAPPRVWFKAGGTLRGALACLIALSVAACGVDGDAISKPPPADVGDMGPDDGGADE